MGSWLGFWHRIPIQRRKRIALFTAAMLAMVLTLWAARSVLGLYMVGLILAYVLAPAVKALQHGLEWLGNKVRLRFLARGARGVSIIISYLLLIAAVVGFISMVVPIVVGEAEQLWETREVIWKQISIWFEQVVREYELLPDRARLQIDDTIRELSSFVTGAFQQAIQGTFSAISYTTSIILGITIVPFWTFFLLRDIDLIQDSIHRMLPGAIRDDLRSILRMLDRTIGDYLRGEIGLMLIVGVMQTIALTLLGLEYALLLGLLAGILEIVPNIGPTIAAVPAILVALTHSPGLALVTVVVCILIQNIENSFIVPRVLGRSVGLHPVVMMVMLVVGTEIAGLPGLVLAPILTAVLRDVYRYLVYRFADTPYQPTDALVQVLSDEPFSTEI